MLVGNDIGKGEFKENWLCNKYSVAWLQNVKHKKNVKHNIFCKVLFQALQAGSEDHDSENAHGCCSDKAAHISKFILASLANKEAFVLMLSESLNQTTDVPNPE